MKANRGCHIEHSAEESHITGLKTGRSGLIESLDEKELLKVIQREKYDFVRLKISASDHLLFRKLNRLPYPHQLYNIQSRVLIKIKKEDRFPVLKKGITYEVYDGSQEKIIASFVRDALRLDSGINFQSALFEKLVPAKKRTEAAIRYAQSFIFSEKGSKIIYLLKYNNEYIGFGMCSYDRKNFEGLLIGIKKKYYGNNFAQELLKIGKKFCADRGIPDFSNNIVIQNKKSLKSMVNEGAIPLDIYLNIFLFPLLSKRNK